MGQRQLQAIMRSPLPGLYSLASHRFLGAESVIFFDKTAKELSSCPSVVHIALRTAVFQVFARTA